MFVFLDKFKKLRNTALGEKVTSTNILKRAFQFQQGGWNWHYVCPGLG